MNNTIKFLVNKDDSGDRADVFLSKKINPSDKKIGL